MNPPPPMLPASGCTTSSAKPTATAASTALPPCCMIRTPTSLAIGLPETTMPRGAVTALVRANSGQSAGMLGGGTVAMGGGGAGGLAQAASSSKLGSPRWASGRKRVIGVLVDPVLKAVEI